MPNTKQARALQEKLSEGRATLKAMDQQRRQRVSSYAYWMLQGILLDARVAGLPDRELDAIAYRVGQICHDIAAGFPHKAGAVHHG
ncbi:MAG: hypothetical protein WC830_18230 [Burkholderiales bacterium]|jgi:hypothetical protein